MGATEITDNQSPQAADAVRWIKTAICALFFVAAAAFFADVSRVLLDDYFMLFVPTKEVTVPWLVRLGIAALLLLLMFGVTSVLVRPPLLAGAAYVAGIAAYALILGGGPVIWLAAGAVSVLLVAFNFFVVRQFENQVDFSARPLGDKELLLCSMLAVLLAVPAGLGYVRDSTRRHYIIPPQITSMLREQANGYVATMVDSQHLPEPQRGLVLQASEEQMGIWIGDAEKKAEPYQRYIPIVLGVAAYFTFQLLLFVPGVAAAALIGPVFSLLRLTRFARVSRYERVVSRLTLKRKPSDTKSGSAGARQAEDVTWVG